MGALTVNLPGRRAVFVREYLIDFNATQAAIRAGYSVRTGKAQGSRLLTNADVAAAIAEAQADRAAHLGIDADWVLRRLRDLSDRCAQAVPVIDKSGQETGMYVFNASGAIRAAELVGKHLGMFRERVELTGKDGGAIRAETCDAVADARLAAVVARVAAAAEYTGVQQLKNEGSQEAH